MKRRKIFIAVLGTVFLASFYGSILGEMKSGGVTLSPQFGRYMFDESEDVENGPISGVGLGYNFTEHLGIEGTFNYIETESEHIVTGKDLEGLAYRLDGLYHFMPRSQFVPYLRIGGGILKLDKHDGGSDNDAFFNYGIGFDFFLTKAMALRGDVRHIIATDDSEANFAYVVGLTVQLGGKAEEMVPVPSQPVDSDGDGVYDDVDRCPGTPAGLPVDSEGCSLDNDGDGVNDSIDRCPGTPVGAIVDRFGCPVDSDRDGVSDYLDRCPGTPEGIEVDIRGCPAPVEEKVSIELEVQFDINKAEIKSIYHEHLQKVANFMKAYPDTEAVIEGHTDSIGSDRYNLKLSEKRAKNVRKYIIDNYGIEHWRIHAKGYGESRPIADNRTEEGRQRNRRVVAVISTIVVK